MKPVTTTMTGLDKLEDSLANFDFGSLFELTRDGKTLCPFHNEKTASFLVDSRRGHCFGCGWHGDVLDYLEQHEGMSKSAAIEWLEQRAGLPTAQRVKSVSKSKATCKGCETKPFTDALHIKYWQRLEQLGEVPKALQGRGFTLDDCKVKPLALQQTVMMRCYPSLTHSVISLPLNSVVIVLGRISNATFI